MIPNDPQGNEQDLDLEQLLKDAGLGDTGKPKVKIGDTEVDPTDHTALQAALDQQANSYRNEMESLRNAIQQNARYVGPEGRAPSATPQPVVVHQAPPKPANWTAEDWAKIMTADPEAGFKATLGKVMGLDPGNDPIQVLNAMAGKLQHLESTQQTTFQALQQTLATERNEREAERFMAAHPDYEANDQNRDMLEAIRVQNGLPSNATGWHAAFLMGQSQGQFKAPRGQAQDTTPAPTVRNQRVPSLRTSGGTSGEPDFSTIMERLDRMPEAEARRVIEKLSQGGHQV